MSATATRIVTAGLSMAAALLLGACASSSSSPGATASSARAIGSSALANPTISSELNAEETLLLNNLKDNFDGAHPIKSVETAIRLTFPRGNLHSIEKYAVVQFTPSVMTTSGPGSARDIWLGKVVTYAQGTQGIGSPGATPATGPATGQASIPGAEPSPTGSH